MRTVYGDHQRFMDTYFATFDNMYFTGDGCRRDDDGYYWITGRVDDVMNISGHRMGTAEVESALVAYPDVAEAAVVGVYLHGWTSDWLCEHWGSPFGLVAGDLVSGFPQAMGELLANVES